MALAARAPAPGAGLVDAVVNRTELATPPSITMNMVKGFALYFLRAVTSGRGDELIDLAQTAAARMSALRRNRSVTQNDSFRAAYHARSL